MLKIKTTAEIVTMSEIYRICEEAGLGPSLEKSQHTLTEILFGEVHYDDGEYRRLSRYHHIDFDRELEVAIQEGLADDDEEMLALQVEAVVQKALKEAGVEDHILIEIGD